MAILSNVNGKFAVDSTGAIQFSGSAGTSGYILRSNGNAAPTWVTASTVIGGPYLPLAGGTLTGATATASGINFTVGGNLFGTSATFSASISASGNSNTFGNTTIGALSASTGTFSASITAAGNSNSFGATTFAGNVTLDPAANSDVTLKLHSNSGALGDAYAWNLIAESSGDNYEFSIAQGTTDVLKFNNTAAAGNNNATFAGTVETTTLRTDVINNKANSANIIYRSGTQTIIGGGSSTQKLKIEDGGDATFAGNIYLSGGAYLGGTSTAHKLDFYKTDTWAPQIYYQNATDQANATNSTQTGIYTKIGNVCTVQFRLIWTITGTPAVDNIGIKNLPFGGNGTQAYAEVPCSLIGYTGGPSPRGNLTLTLPGSNQTLSIFNDTNNIGNMGNAIGSGTKEIRFSFTYLTN